MARLPFFLLAASLLAAASCHAATEPQPPPPPTGKEVAELVGVDLNWWDVRIPQDLGPRDTVRLVFLSAEGKTLQTDAETPGPFPTGTVRVFCWENTAERKTATCVQVSLGGKHSIRMTSLFPKDYFRNPGRLGLSIGSLVDLDDPLLAFNPEGVVLKLEAVRHP